MVSMLKIERKGILWGLFLLAGSLRMKRQRKLPFHPLSFSLARLNAFSFSISSLGHFNQEIESWMCIHR